MIDHPWTSEDAAVAADTAMDRGVHAAELWRYLPPILIQQLVGCPALFNALLPDTNYAWANAQTGGMYPWTLGESTTKAGVHIGKQTIMRRALTGAGTRTVTLSRIDFLWASLARAGTKQA